MKYYPKVLYGVQFPGISPMSCYCFHVNHLAKKKKGKKKKKKGKEKEKKLKKQRGRILIWQFNLYRHLSRIYPRVVISRKESTCGLIRNKTSKAVLSPAWIAPSIVPGQFLAYSLEVNKILSRGGNVGNR